MQFEELGGAGVEEWGLEEVELQVTALLGKRAPWRWMIQGGLMQHLSSLSLMMRTGTECQEKQQVCQPGLTLRTKERRQLIDKSILPRTFTLYLKKADSNGLIFKFIFGDMTLHEIFRRTYNRSTITLSGHMLLHWTVGFGED